MAFGVKTNERPGTRAMVRYVRMSAYKAREVLDLIRGKEIGEAQAILQFVERDAAIVISKLLSSAVANAEKNDGQDPDDLYVSACFADEGPTLKRWRPRARGRATRIRKRTCHITMIVSRLPEDQLERRRQREAAAPAARTSRRAGRAAVEARRARVAKSREERRGHDHDEHDHDEHDHDHEHEHDDGAVDEAVETAEVEAPEVVDEIEHTTTDDAAESDTEDEK
jgi:large subunit ribosomal protein L22